MDNIDLRKMQLGERKQVRTDRGTVIYAMSLKEARRKAEQFLSYLEHMKIRVPSVNTIDDFDFSEFD